MEKENRHYCDNCNERIFRKGYMVNGKLYCSRCMESEFKIKFDSSEYIVPNKEFEEVSE